LPSRSRTYAERALTDMPKLVLESLMRCSRSLPDYAVH